MTVATVPWDAAVYASAGSAWLAGLSPWAVDPALPGGWVYPSWWLWLAVLTAWSWQAWQVLVCAAIVFLVALWHLAGLGRPWPTVVLVVGGLSLAGQTVVASGNAAALEVSLVWAGLVLWIAGGRDAWAAVLVAAAASMKGPAVLCLLPLWTDARSRPAASVATGVWLLAMGAAYALSPWSAAIPALTGRPVWLAATDVACAAGLPAALGTVAVAVPVLFLTWWALPGAPRAWAAVLSVAAWLVVAPGLQPYTLLAAVPCVLAAAGVVERLRWGGYVAVLVLFLLMPSPLAPGRLPLDLPRLLLRAPYLWIVATWWICWIGTTRRMSGVVGGVGPRDRV